MARKTDHVQGSRKGSTYQHARHKTVLLSFTHFTMALKTPAALCPLHTQRTYQMVHMHRWIHITYAQMDTQTNSPYMLVSMQSTRTYLDAYMKYIRTYGVSYIYA